MYSCPHCHSPLVEPIPDACPSCGRALAAIGLPEPAVSGEPPTERAAEPVEPAAEPLEPAQEPAAAPASPPALPPWSAPPPGSAPAGAVPPFGWDARSQIGIANAFVETTQRVLLAPVGFFRSMPVTGGLGSPLLYAVIAGWIGIAAGALYQAIWVAVVGPTLLPFGLERAELAQAIGFLESWAGLVAQVVFGGFSVVISVFVAAGILHLVLLAMGGARRGFEATFRVVCFSQATMLLFVIPLFLIPLCGLVGVVWCLALYAVGLAEAHRIGRGQALAAVLVPLLLLCCCCAGIVAVFAGAIASLAGYAG